jgi:hypothetical protein
MEGQIGQQIRGPETTVSEKERAISSTIRGVQEVGVRRLALTKREAAAALGMSVDSFERHVQPDLRVVRRGRLRLFALTEIERWLRENGAKTLEP